MSRRRSQGDDRIVVQFSCGAASAVAALLSIAEYGDRVHIINAFVADDANCPGCPKGGMGYWNKIRADFPGRYEEVARIQDVLGEGSYFFRDRGTGKRISLRMLDPTAGRHEPLEDFECGATCELPEQLSLLEGS